MHSREAGEQERQIPGAPALPRPVHNGGPRTGWHIVFIILAALLLTVIPVSAAYPSVTGITPSAGVNTTTVSVTDLAGSGFETGATAVLTPVDVNPVHTGSIINRVGGAELDNPYSIAVSGNYAYVASYNTHSLEIIDITDPANPRHKGKITSDDAVIINKPRDVAVSGNYAYVVSEGSDSLEIVDISDPATPILKGSISHGTDGALMDGAYSVAVSGNYAYVASYTSGALEIVDISDPTNPTHKGSISKTTVSNLNFANSVAVSGDYAYVTNMQGVLVIIDVSTPATPVLAGTLTRTVAPSLTLSTNVYVSGNYAYVVSGTTSSNSALEIVDISLPASPAHAGNITTKSAPSILKPQDVVIVGDFAYVTGYSSSALEIVNIATKTAPQHAGNITSTSAANLTYPRGIAVSGNYAYVVGDSDALEIVDISNTANPTHKGSIVDNAGGPWLNLPHGIYVYGNYAYVVSTNSDSLEIVDVTDPVNPIHKGSIVNGVGGALLNEPSNVVVSGNYAYVASLGSNALEIVDITDPANPRHKGSLVISGLSYPYDVIVIGNYAYVTRNGGLTIVDISDPTSPAITGNLEDGSGGAQLSNPKGIAVYGNYAYVASLGSNALEIVDVTDPANPIHKGSINDGTGGALLSQPYGVTVAGNYAYVASQSSCALEIVDITNPANPTHKGSISGGSTKLLHAQNVYVSGNYAYIVSGTTSSNSALEIVDVTDPANPTHKGSISDGGGVAPYLESPTSVYVSGKYAYVASKNSNALEIVDIGNVPVTGVTVTSPTKITGTFDLTNRIAGLYNVVVTNPRGFFAVLSSGFTAKVPTTPSFTSISPVNGTSAGGTAVTITGTGFASASAVTFDGTPATAFTVISDTQITATTPAHADGAVNVVVTVPGGSATGAYTYGIISSSDNSSGSRPSGGEADPADANAVQDTLQQGQLKTVSASAGQVGSTSIVQVAVTGVKINDVIVTATEAHGPGNGIPPPPGEVYEYADITPARYTAITATTIQFYVPQSWLDEHGFTPQDITMYHNAGNDWQALPTTLDHSANGLVYFTATGTGFSRFAITGDRKITQESGNVTATGTVPAYRAPTQAAGSSSSAATGNGIVTTPIVTMTTAVPGVQPDSGLPIVTLMAAGVVCVVLAAGGFLVRRWWIRRQNPALFRDND